MTIFDFLADNKFTKVKVHLANFLDLYTRPLMVYKKIISNRKTSFNYISLHVIYYTLFSLLFLQSEYIEVIQYVFFEVVLTLLPTFIFLIPFIFFTKKLNLKLKWNRLYRLFLILKLQILPIFILLELAIERLAWEEGYIIYFYLLFFLIIGLIIIFPLLQKIKWYWKAVWCVSNYFAFLIYLIMFPILISQAHINIKKIDQTFPMFEFSKLSSELYDVYLYIDRFHYLEFFNETGTWYKNQFATNELSYIILNECLKSNEIIMKRYDSLIHLGQTKGRQIDVMSRSEQIDTSYLNKIRQEFNEVFYSDKELAEYYKDSASFESNRQYFKAYYNYLNAYESLYTYPDSLDFGTRSFDYCFILSKNDIRIFLHRLDSTVLEKEFNEFIIINNRKVIETKIFFMPLIIFIYPISWIFENEFYFSLINDIY